MRDTPERYVAKVKAILILARKLPLQSPNTKNNNMKKLSALLLAVLLLAACNRNPNESQAGYEDEVYAPATYKNEEVVADQPQVREAVERKLIKEGTLQFETDELEKTHAHIEALLNKYGGYLAEDAQEKGYNRIMHNLVIRIPASNFDQFVAALSNGITYFDEKRIGIHDVTENYVDLEARLKTKKELEKRYLQLLEKANNVEDILNIEREIANLRSDIEAMEGRFRVMQNQIAYATLHINYYVKEIEVAHGNGYRFKRALQEGWEGLIGFFVAMITAWPALLIIGIGLFWLIKRIRRKKG